MKDISIISEENKNSNRKGDDEDLEQQELPMSKIVVTRNKYMKPFFVEKSKLRQQMFLSTWVRKINITPPPSENLLKDFGYYLLVKNESIVKNWR